LETRPETGVRVGVVVFPGSNDDRDLMAALEQLGARVEPVWHKDTRLPEGLRGIGIPGGFSYGDYLRCGAMARFSPVMAAVAEHARAGGPTLGICNGFQILCESGLLPGALVRNRDLRFVCDEVKVRAENTGQFQDPGNAGVLLLPIKHGEGAYVPDPTHPPRVAFRYADQNPNGTTDGIAGVVNEAGNVLGLMPHPEHAVDAGLSCGTDGAAILRGFLAAAARWGKA
jgi:phosphoribosylformylglycinamidine synthase subunit PurQ / glutaminase